jgi:hypothetical protein
MGGQNSSVTSKPWPPACRSASRRARRGSCAGRESPFDARRLRCATVKDLLIEGAAAEGALLSMHGKLA